jgi:methionine sulfoxide reductase heme-binding subunit
MNAAMLRIVAFRSRFQPLRRRVFGRRLSQWLAFGIAAAPTTAFIVSAVLFALNVVTREEAVGLALGAIEVPGMLLLGAMMWCSPASNFVGRPFRVERRAFGIGFGLTGFANFAMFLIEHPARDLALPFAIAATVAVLAVTPLLLTSTRAAMRRLGSANWTKVHRLAYVAAVAVVVHLWLVPQDDGPGGNIVATAIVGGAFLLRIPTVKAKIVRTQRRKGASLLKLSTWVQD